MIFALWGIAGAAEKAPVVPVKVIEIKGNRRIDRNTILFKLETREGEPFSIYKIRRDVKTLYETGFFDDVKVDVEPFEGGVKVTFIVKERPVVTRIRIVGNKHIKSSEIRKELKQFPFNIYNEKILNENIQKIKQLYQSKGYYSVQVIPEVKPRGEGRIELTYKIKEGKKASVARIEFVGNKFFSDRELKKQMVTKEKTLFNMVYVFVNALFGKPATYYYIPDLLEVDLMKIRQFYKDHGFLRVVVGTPEVKTDKRRGKIYIRIPIEEGPRYKVESVDIKMGKDDPFKKEDLLKILLLKPGEYYNAKKMRKDVTNLTDLYGSKGYVNADVRPLLDTDDEKHTVSVVYRIEKGKKWYVGRIEISGNVKTRDKVIRREIPLAEGEVMNTMYLKLAKKRLERLGYFSSVNIETKPAEDLKGDYMNVFVKVEEQPTGSMMLGGGYSTAESFGVMAQISEKNLFGTGRSISLTGEFTTKRVDYTLNFYDPYFMDTIYSFALSSYHQEYEYDLYTEKGFGLTVSFGRPLWNWYTRVSAGYSFEYVRITDVDYDAPDFIKDEEDESNISSAVVFSISQDTRNSHVLPTEGFYRTLSLKLAGLGGDYAYYRVYANWERFISVGKFIKDSVFHPRVRVGFVNPLPWGDGRPVYERFYVGGQTTVRGFDTDEASPEEDGDAIGGTKEFIMNLEYLFPIIGGLKGLLFYDMGAAFDNGQMISMGPMRESVGVGIRFITPFGPLKVDWAYKLDRRKDEDAFKIHFSVGTIF